MNTTFGVLMGASALNLGQSWLTVISLLATAGNFYLSTWEEFHTGVLYLGYFNGPDEGVLLLITVYLISAINGPLWWTQSFNRYFGLLKSPLPDSVQLNEAFIGGTFIVVLFILASW